ncbi:hypothetical protein BpHYR1_053058 [Brachionus plicatilis]|uniref:Uncharacterized protein n=1 Tax=Brachionus plicatilis TaxID=10195 RepID=A0A3M7T060_BRAPC|nr:hypothetical protein BpHYR1_053058 [Brachionus plicatilis]
MKISNCLITWVLRDYDPIEPQAINSTNNLKYFIQKLNSNLIFIRNATYSNIDSNMHIRFHH